MYIYIYIYIYNIKLITICKHVKKMCMRLYGNYYEIIINIFTNI